MLLNNEWVNNEIKEKINFSTTTIKYQKQKLGKNPIYYSNKKNKVPGNKLNQGGKRPVPGKLQNTEEIKEDAKQMEAYTMFMD